MKTLFSFGSGPRVARLFDRLLALIFLIAWISLGSQVRLLIGSRGLLPAAPFMSLLRDEVIPFSDAPTWLRWASSDSAIMAGIAIGIVLSIVALAGVLPRVCFATMTFLYLGYAVASRTFLSFQWDNLLLECGLVATWLPRDRKAELSHTAMRVLLFKLYFESGLAKWLSPLGDWKDGSAMTFYYETAPLPTRLAHFAHSRSASYHHLESWFTLFFELALPFAIFSPRKARLVAAATFTVFQLVNIATANYGFFAYLAIALHVFLLDDADITRARRWIEKRFRMLGRARLAIVAAARRIQINVAARRIDPTARKTAFTVFLAIYAGASLLEGLGQFAGWRDAGSWVEPLAPFRVINTYHLFAAITRERIEPQVETFDGATWTEHDLVHKPGDPRRAPDFVAPHQPRVDFQLWFYGLGFRRGTPDYVRALLDRVCHDREIVSPLFAAPLPDHPRAVRLAFFRYKMTTREELSETGAYWNRTPLGTTPPLQCE